ncbi:MAG: hypothetical protein IJD00_06905 [Clostridia bacterium]|nr:hypothetical protein [Clostridia bacterium]
MKKINIKSVFALVLCLAMVLSINVYGAAEKPVDVTSGLSTMQKTDEYKLVGEDSGLKLFLNPKTTNFYVEDVKTGERAYAFPESFPEGDETALAQQIEMQAALVFTFWDPVKKTENRKNSNAVCVKQGNYTVYSKENGFLIKYVLKSQKMEICLSVTLENGKLYCSIPANSVKEEAPETAMLLKVAVLPFMVRGEANTDGTIILPDGSGQVLDFSTTRMNAAVYLKPIYGRDLSATLSVEDKTGYDINCPYLAVTNGDNGILAIPEKGAAVGYVNANPAGKSNNYANAYFSYDYRAGDIAIIGDKQTMASQSTRVFSEDVYNDDITVSYSFVFENATMSALAKLYGEYLIPENSQKDDKHSAIIDIFGFVNEPKSFFGFPYTAVSVISKGEDIVSFAENEKLKGATINLKNITKEQQKGTLDTKIKLISKVISKSQLKAISANDVNLYVDVDPITFSKNTFAVNSFFTASKTIYGAPIGLYEYRESTHMVNKNVAKKLLLKYTKIDSILGKLTSSAKKLDVDGLSSETLGSMSYHDHSNGGTLADTHSAIEAAIASAHNKTSLILSSPNDYAIKYCSAITDIPIESSNDDMCSGSYPFLQMALGDRISYTTESINLYRSPETMFLKALATGSALRYNYILSDTEPIIGTELNYLYSADFSSFKEMTERQYSTWQEVNAKTKGSALVGYTENENTIVAEFANGTVVTVDLSSKSYSVAG